METGCQHSPLTVILPDEVIERLEALGVPRLEMAQRGFGPDNSDYRLEETFGEDMAAERVRVATG